MIKEWLNSPCGTWKECLILAGITAGVNAIIVLMYRNSVKNLDKKILDYYAKEVSE